MVCWLRNDVALDERPPIRSSASKLKTRRCRAHLLPRGSPLEAADSESLLLLRRANMMSAIMMPKPINVTGTATAACIPGEHMPVHDFASERTPVEPPVEEAAAGDVKDVVNVELVGEFIELDAAAPAPLLDVELDVIVADEDVCAVDVDARVDALVEVLLSTADVSEVVPPIASVRPVAASEVVVGGGADDAGSTLGVVVKNVCVARKDDMTAGVLKAVASNAEKDDCPLLNVLAIVCLFRPSRPLPRSLPVQTRDPGLRLFSDSTAVESSRWCESYDR